MDYVVILIGVLGFPLLVAQLYNASVGRGEGFNPQALAWSLVQAAEQMFSLEDGDTNKDKFDYVMELMRKHFPTLHADVLEALIEAAVYGLKQNKPVTLETTLVADGSPTFVAAEPK